MHFHKRVRRVLVAPAATAMLLAPLSATAFAADGDDDCAVSDDGGESSLAEKFSVEVVEDGPYYAGEHPTIRVVNTSGEPVSADWQITGADERSRSDNFPPTGEEGSFFPLAKPLPAGVFTVTWTASADGFDDACGEQTFEVRDLADHFSVEVIEDGPYYAGQRPTVRVVNTSERDVVADWQIEYDDTITSHSDTFPHTGVSGVTWQLEHPLVAGTYTVSWSAQTDRDSTVVSDTQTFTVLAAPPSPTPDPTPEPEPVTPAPQPVPELVDVPSDSVHAGAIEQLYVYGITVGTSEETFNPGGTVDRQQMSSFLVRLLRHADPDVEVPANHDEAMDLLAERGILKGDTSGNHNGTDALTRGQAASLLVRLIEQISGAPLSVGEAEFTDVDGNVHAENIAKLVDAGIVFGYADDTFRPNDTLRRDQMAALIARAIDQLIATGQIGAVDAS